MSNSSRRDVKSNHMESRVVTDAVHRLFKPNHANKSTETEKNPPDGNMESYFCNQCNSQINISPGSRDLKLHFESKSHMSCGNCVYCHKPVYEYFCNDRRELYHVCNYN